MLPFLCGGGVVEFGLPELITPIACICVVSHLWWLGGGLGHPQLMTLVFLYVVCCLVWLDGGLGHLHLFLVLTVLVLRLCGGGVDWVTLNILYLC